VEPAAAGITIEAFKLVSLEHPAPAGCVHCQIDGSKRAFDAMVFRGYQFGRPHFSAVDAIRPVSRNPIGVRDHPFEFDHGFGDLVLHARVVSHRARHIGDRRFFLILSIVRSRARSAKPI
jgi:hypothetical protein